jgi:hypothetical protein
MDRAPCWTAVLIVALDGRLRVLVCRCFSSRPGAGVVLTMLSGCGLAMVMRARMYGCRSRSECTITTNCWNGMGDSMSMTAVLLFRPGHTLLVAWVASEQIALLTGPYSRGMLCFFTNVHTVQLCLTLSSANARHMQPVRLLSTGSLCGSSSPLDTAGIKTGQHPVLNGRSVNGMQGLCGLLPPTVRITV